MHGQKINAHIIVYLYEGLGQIIKKFNQIKLESFGIIYNYKIIHTIVIEVIHNAQN